jgi:hypothetical protein
LLPVSELPVLDTQLRQFRGNPIYGSRIERLKLFPEQPLRPSIRDKVMNYYRQCMVIFAQFHELGAQQALLFDGETRAQEFLCLSLDPNDSSKLGARSKIEALNVRPSRFHHLNCFALPIQEYRSQHLVAFADHSDARRQRLLIERSRQTSHLDDVVIVSCRIHATQDVNSTLLE